MLSVAVPLPHPPPTLDIIIIRSQSVSTGLTNVGLKVILQHQYKDGVSNQFGTESESLVADELA